MKAGARRSLAAAFIAFAAVACGDSSGPGGGPVALLTNVSYVDYDTSNAGSEASNLEFTIKSFGYVVTQVNAIDSAALAGVLRTSGVFVIPEAGGDIWLDMTAGARTVLERFVDSSGGVLVVTADDAGLGLVDSLFGYTISSGLDSIVSVFNGTNAAGTPFAAGAPLLYDNNGTYYFDPATLPTAGKAIYITAGGAGASVGYMTQGRGVVVFIGWDWYQAMPKGAQDNGWLEILRRALRS